MYNMFSLALGAASLCVLLGTLVPSYAIFAWAAVPLAAMGTAFGILSRADSGRWLSMFAMTIAVGRLVRESLWFQSLFF
jgi:multidrug efflux pump subunit AcrB